MADIDLTLQPSHEEAKDFGESLVYGELTDAPAHEVYTELQTAREESATSNEKNPTLWENMKNEWAVGDLQTRLDHASFNHMNNRNNPEYDPSEYEALRSEYTAAAAENENNRPTSTVRKMLRKSTQMIPHMWDSIYQGIDRGVKAGMGAATTAAILGQIGPQVATPEEAITIPAAWTFAYGAGQASGTFEASHQKSTGMVYRILTEMEDEFGNKIDEDVAAEIAQVSGGFMGLLDIAAVGKIMKHIPGADAISKRVLARTMAKVAEKKGLKEVAARWTKEVAETTFVESGIEVAQKAIEITGREFAKEWNNELYQTDFSRSEWAEIGKELYHEGIEAMISMPFISALGPTASAGRSIVLETDLLEQSKKIISSQEGAITVGPGELDPVEAREHRLELVDELDAIKEAAKGEKNVGEFLKKKGWNMVEVHPTVAHSINTWVNNEEKKPFVNDDIDLDAERAMQYKNKANGADWYRETGLQDILAGESEAEQLKFYGILAYTSVQATPESNLSKALMVWQRYKEGASPEEAVKGSVTGDIESKMAAILNGEGFDVRTNKFGVESGSVKISSFAETLQRGTEDPANLYDYDRSVIDFRMGQYYYGEDTVPTNTARERIEKRILDVRDRLREKDDGDYWTADRVQAALWNWSKDDRVERGLDRPAGEALTYGESLRRRASRHFGITRENLTDEMTTAFVQMQLLRSTDDMAIFDHYVQKRPVSQGHVEFQYLDPSQQGTAFAGREWTNQIEPGVDRPNIIHVYKSSTPAEAPLWHSQRMRGLVMNGGALYDLAKDPDGYKEKHGVTYDAVDPKKIGDMERAMMKDGFHGYMQGDVYVFFSPTKAYEMRGMSLNISPSVTEEQIAQAEKAGDVDTVRTMKELKEYEEKGMVEEFQDLALIDAQDTLLSPMFDMLRMDAAEGLYVGDFELSLEGFAEVADDTIFEGKVAQYLKKYQQDAGYVSKVVPGVERPKSIPKKQAPSFVFKFDQNLSREKRNRLAELLAEAGIGGSTWTFFKNSLVLDHVALMESKTKTGKATRGHFMTAGAFEKAVRKFNDLMVNEKDMPTAKSTHIWKDHTVIAKENYDAKIKRGKAREKALGIEGDRANVGERTEDIPRHIRQREDLYDPEVGVIRTTPAREAKERQQQKVDKLPTLDNSDQYYELKQGQSLFEVENDHNEVFFDDHNTDGSIQVTEEYGGKDTRPVKPSLLTTLTKKAWTAIKDKFTEQRGSFSLEDAQKGPEKYFANLDITQDVALEEKVALKNTLVQGIKDGTFDGAVRFRTMRELLDILRTGKMPISTETQNIHAQPIMGKEDDVFAAYGRYNEHNFAMIFPKKYLKEKVDAHTKEVLVDPKVPVEEITFLMGTDEEHYTFDRLRQALSNVVSALRSAKAKLSEERGSFSLEESEKIAGKRSPKTRIRALSGQVKLGELQVKESVAMAAGMKKAEQAARKAFAEGKKFGVDITKVKIEDLRASSKEKAKRAAGKAEAQKEGIRFKNAEKILKLKKTFDKYKDAVKAQKASARERKYVAGVIDYLKKVQKVLPKLPKGVKEPLSSWLQDLDLTKLSANKKLSLEKTRAWLNDQDNVELPDKVMADLERLDKVPLRDFTVEDIQSLEMTVKHYMKLAQTMNRIKRGREFRRKEEVVAESISDMKPPDLVTDEMVSSQRSTMSKAKEKGKLVTNLLTLGQWHYDLVTELIAGPMSAIHDVLFRQVKPGVIKQLDYKQKTLQEFTDGIAELRDAYGIENLQEWLDERVPVGKFNLTRGERMALYRHSLNPDNHRAIVEGGFGLKSSENPNFVHKITEEELQEVLESLDPEEIAFAGAPVDALFDAQQQALADVFYEKNGYELPLEETYYPKDTMPLGYGDQDFEAESALDRLQGRYIRVGLSKGMLKERKRVALPIYLNSIEHDIVKSVHKSAAYIGLEIPLSNASNLLYDKRFRAELTNRYGKDLWNTLEKGLKDIAGQHQTIGMLEDVMLKHRARVTTAVLGLNPWVMFKQIVSLPVYSVYVNPRYLFEGVINSVLHPKETAERHKMYSPEYLERVSAGYSRDIAEVFQASQSVMKSIGGKTKGLAGLRERVMGGIQFFDKTAVVPGMEGAVLQVLDEFRNGKLSEQVKIALGIEDADIADLSAGDKMRLAYSYADFVTERTQPMFSPEHRSSLSRGGAIEKMFSMYSSFTNQGYNLMRRTMDHGRRTGDWKPFATSIVTLMFINTMGIYLIDLLRDIVYDRDRDIDLKDFMKNFVGNVSGYVLFLRDIVKSLTTGYDIDIPFTKMMNDFVDVGQTSLKWLTETKSKKKKAQAKRIVDRSLSFILTLMGVPYSTPRQVGKVVKEKVEDLGEDF